MTGAGDLHVPLVLETSEGTPDGAGGVVQGWRALGTLWAAVVPAGFAQTRSGPGELLLARHRVTVRAAPPGAADRPLPGQRFRLGARVLRIRRVRDDSRAPGFLTCDTEEEGGT